MSGKQSREGRLAHRWESEKRNALTPRTCDRCGLRMRRAWADGEGVALEVWRDDDWHPVDREPECRATTQTDEWDST